MKDEEYNNLLEEVVKDDTSIERKLEICKKLQDDRKASIDAYQELSDNTGKLQADYKALKNQKVTEFFNSGVKVEENTQVLEDEEDEEPKAKTYDEIVDEMLGVSENAN